MLTAKPWPEGLGCLEVEWGPGLSGFGIFSLFLFICALLWDGSRLLVWDKVRAGLERALCTFSE